MLWLESCIVYLSDVHVRVHVCMYFKRGVMLLECALWRSKKEAREGLKREGRVSWPSLTSDPLFCLCVACCATVCTSLRTNETECCCVREIFSKTQVLTDKHWKKKTIHIHFFLKTMTWLIMDALPQHLESHTHSHTHTHTHTYTLSNSSPRLQINRDSSQTQWREKVQGG